MKVTVQQRPEDSGFINAWSTTFESPGGTLGRSVDNHLTLPDPEQRICRIQAALRMTDDACYLLNLSSMSHVSVNGHALQKGQEVPLAFGDELIIGPYTLKTEDPSAPADTEVAAISSGFAALSTPPSSTTLSEPDPLRDSPMAHDVNVAPDALPNDASSQDIFGDLFGPGTLPVGSVPDVSAHPFDMASAQHRNPDDPLSDLPQGDANVVGPLRDPLDLLETQDGHDVFSDSTPSTLPSLDPLAPHRLDPMSDMLDASSRADNHDWTARDHLHEYGGSYMRPARVKSSAPVPDNIRQDTDTPRRD